jgi:hypothetical protein
VSASRGLSSPQQGQCDSQCDSSVPIRLRAGAGSQKPPTRILASHWVPRASPGNSSASNQYLHVYNRFYFRYRVKPALLARLVPCLLSHIVVRTVRFRRLKSSTFLGNDSSAFSPKRRFSQICVGFIQVILRCVGVCMKLRLNQVRLVDPFGPYTCPAACCYRFYRGYLEFKSECQRGGCSALH